MRFKNLSTIEVAIATPARFYWHSRGVYSHSKPRWEFTWYVGAACAVFSTADFPVDANGNLPGDILCDYLDTAHIRSRNYAFS